MGLGEGAGGHHLNTMSAQEAFRAYETVRHRLPTATASTTDSAREVATLAEISQAFDVFLLDAFGVLNIGETAIEGTAQRIMDLKAAGKRVLVVSNAAGYPHAALVQKYARLGFDFKPEEIVTSRATLLDALPRDKGLHWGLMASRKAGPRDLETLTFTYLENDPAAYEKVEGFLLIGSAEWTEDRQALLESALARRPRPVLVGNPDIVAPRETGFSREPGYFAHRLADRTGIEPRFFGKPFANIFDLAFNRIGDVPRERVLMVGDSLHTDILGAKTAGLASALIKDFGFFAGQDVHSAIRQSGITPDYLVRRP